MLALDDARPCQGNVAATRAVHTAVCARAPPSTGRARHGSCLPTGGLPCWCMHGTFSVVPLGYCWHRAHAELIMFTEWTSPCGRARRCDPDRRTLCPVLPIIIYRCYQLFGMCVTLSLLVKGLIKLNLDDPLPTNSWKIRVVLDDRKKGQDQILFFSESIHSFKEKKVPHRKRAEAQSGSERL